MKRFDVDNLVRENIKNLKPYASARKEFEGKAEVFLDANENSFGSPDGSAMNRYPDPLQTEIKRRLSESKSVAVNQIFVGNGSDEAIDLLFRIFCEPGRDEAIICPPTYGMYKVAAEINDVRVVEARLTPDFELDVAAIFELISGRTNLVFICSPNNPSGNLMRRESIFEIAENFDGIVVVDEAYIHFANSASLLDKIEEFPNLVVLQTFSKAWGLAGLRVGLAFANPKVIDLFNRVKPPYNISQIAQNAVLKAFNNKSTVDEWVIRIIEHREKLALELLQLSRVEKVYRSDANFILASVADANAIYKYLLTQKIVVRNRNSVELCEGCLRITVGTANENKRLIASLLKFEQLI